MPDALRSDPDQIANLPIPLPRGHDAETPAKEERRVAFLPLSTFAKCQLTTGYNQISRDNGKRRIVVQCNVRGRDIGSFVEEARQRVEKLALPPGSWLEWGGQFENLLAARQRLSIVVPICFLLIFILLYSTFNSVKHALLVFSGVPLALSGGVLALWLRGIPFSLSAAVGFIALSGVAVLNGLVMVTFINQLFAAGEELDEAILHGSLVRLRPVLMTALVASLGFVPMALATGTGAEVQRPLATVVIGGIVSSTLLTLFVLPAAYRLLHRANRMRRPDAAPASGRKAAGPAVEAEATAVAVPAAR